MSSPRNSKDLNIYILFHSIFIRHLTAPLITIPKDNSKSILFHGFEFMPSLGMFGMGWLIINESIIFEIAEVAGAATLGRIFIIVR